MAQKKPKEIVSRILGDLYSGYPGAPEIRNSGAKKILDALEDEGWRLVRDESEDANQAAARTVREATEGK